MIDPLALWHLACVCGMGAKKYSDNNWRKGYDWGLSYAALHRHLNQFWRGEDADEESGLPHLAHAMWHCMVLMVFSADPHYQDFDNRPGWDELKKQVEAIFGATGGAAGSTPPEISKAPAFSGVYLAEESEDSRRFMSGKTQLIPDDPETARKVWARCFNDVAFGGEEISPAEEFHAK